MRAWDQAIYCDGILSSRFAYSLVRPLAEPFFRPGPHDGAAVARSGGQGRPLSGPPEGLVLDGREHGGRLVIVGNDGHCVMPPFVVDRREISDRGMAAAWIVEAFDEFEDRTVAPRPAS